MEELPMKNGYYIYKGFCPKCKSVSLKYEPMRVEQDDMCWYPYTCEHCGLHGEEWYTRKFVGHNIYDENGDIIELNADENEA